MRNLGGLVLCAFSLACSTSVGCNGRILPDVSGIGGDVSSTSGDFGSGNVGIGSGPVLPPGLWMNRYGDSEDQHLSAFAVNPEGELALAGDARGTIDFGNIPWSGTKTDTDVVVAKLSTDGHALWSRRFGDSCDQRAGAVALFPSGNVLVSGDFCGKMDFGSTGVETSGAEVDLFIAVLDTLGEDVYSVRIGGKGAQIARAAAVDASGNAVIVGSFDQAFDDGTGEAASAGMDDAFVIKLDPAGKVLWSQRFGGPEVDVARAVALDPAGNIVVGGSYGGTVDFGGQPLTAAVGHSHGFVLGLDPDGKTLWSKSFGGDDEAGVSAVAVSAEGDVAAAGFFAGAADFGNGPVTSAGADDMFVARMTIGGGPLWVSTSGASQSQRGVGVTFAPNGEVVAAGTSEEIFDLAPEGGAIKVTRPPSWVGPAMIYSVRLQGTGEMIEGWELMSGAPFSCVGVGYDGKLGTFLAGSFQEMIDYELGAVETAGKWDMFVARHQ